MKARLSFLATARVRRIVLVAGLALIPLSITAWQGVRVSSLPAGAAVAVPFEGEGWQDKVLTHEGYVLPPKDLADAVLAPREMNITLGNPSPDKKWFLDDIGDGPVPMTIFAKPFDELGGVFIDTRANRQRAMTRRNTTGFQLISADRWHPQDARDAGGRARDERAVDAGRRGRALRDAGRRRDVSVDDGRRDEQAAADCQDAAAHDVRHQFRSREQRQDRRRRRRAGRTRGPAHAAADSRRP